MLVQSTHSWKEFERKQHVYRAPANFRGIQFVVEASCEASMRMASAGNDGGCFLLTFFHDLAAVWDQGAVEEEAQQRLLQEQELIPGVVEVEALGDQDVASLVGVDAPSHSHVLTQGKNKPRKQCRKLSKHHNLIMLLLASIQHACDHRHSQAFMISGIRSQWTTQGNEDYGSLRLHPSKQYAVYINVTPRASSNGHRVGFCRISVIVLVFHSISSMYIPNSCTQYETIAQGAVKRGNKRVQWGF